MLEVCNLHWSDVPFLIHYVPWPIIIVFRLINMFLEYCTCRRTGAQVYCSVVYWTLKKDVQKFFCTWYAKDFIRRSGITTMKSHTRCEKHCFISCSRRGSNPISYVVILTDNTEDAENRFVDASNVTRISEICCVTHMVLKNHSFKSQDDLADDSKAICHDSKIPCKMKLHAIKAT